MLAKRACRSPPSSHTEPHVWLAQAGHRKSPPKRGYVNHKGLQEMQRKANPPSKDSPR